MVEDAAGCSEKALIHRAADGDAEAFGDLYVRHLDQIYRYIRGRQRSAKIKIHI